MEAVETMRGWEHGGGFSLNAEVWVSSWDWAGLERLPRYWARPIFAGERLEWIEAEQGLIYRLPKSQPDGQTALYLTPLEFMLHIPMRHPQGSLRGANRLSWRFVLDHLAALVPPPQSLVSLPWRIGPDYFAGSERGQRRLVLLRTGRRDAVRNAPLRPAATAYAGLPMDLPSGPLPSAPQVPPDQGPTETRSAAHVRYLWAVPIARIYEILPLVCPDCGGAMRLIAFVTEADLLRRILTDISEPSVRRRFHPRTPPLWNAFDGDPTPALDSAMGKPVPEFQFDQPVDW